MRRKDDSNACEIFFRSCSCIFKDEQLSSNKNKHTHSFNLFIIIVAVDQL